MHLQGAFILALVACVSCLKEKIAVLDIDNKPVEVTQEDMMTLTELTVVCKRLYT